MLRTKIEGHGCRGALGDPTERDLFVHLPPRYDEGDRRYATAFLLDAFGETAEQAIEAVLDGPRWQPPLQDVLDPVFGRLDVPPMIAVIPDGWSRWGCGLWVDSPVTGNFEQYVLYDVTLVAAAPRHGVAAKWGSTTGDTYRHRQPTRRALTSGCGRRGSSCASSRFWLLRTTGCGNGARRRSARAGTGLSGRASARRRAPGHGHGQSSVRREALPAAAGQPRRGTWSDRQET